MAGVEGVQNDNQIHQAPERDEQGAQSIHVAQADQLKTKRLRSSLDQCLIEEICNERDGAVEGLANKPDLVVLEINGIQSTDKQTADEQEEDSGHDQKSSMTLSEIDMSEAREDPCQQPSRGVAGPWL